MRPVSSYLAAFAVLLLAWAMPARAEMSADEAGRAVASEFGVDVLKVEVDSEDGSRVYLVTFMTPGGDFNGAFQVGTVMVDAGTGRLVSRFRHLPSGYRLSGAPTYGGAGRPDAAQRGVVWR
jgi:hypothetical protein